MLTADQTLALVPQQRPFRFLDRLVEIDETKAIGEYTFRPDELFYAGHFPERPVTPGVILIETMCQTGVVALGIYLAGLELHPEQIRQRLMLLVDSNVEFERQVLPGTRVRVVGEKVYWRRQKLRSSITLALPDGTIAARGTASGLVVSRER